jgi:hypothetical protein
VVVTDPKDQSQIITLTFGTETPTATVKGHLTDTEWDGVADKIKNAINGRYAYYESISADVLTQRWDTVFGRGVTVNVEKTSAYAKWKTTTDGKTMYLNYSQLDNGLQETLGSAVQHLETNEAENG